MCLVVHFHKLALLLVPNRNCFWYVYVMTSKPASRVFLAPPEGLMTFLSSLYHAWQLLLAKFFDLVKLEFWPPGPPEPPGGQGSNLNSLFCALIHEGFGLRSDIFGLNQRFPRLLMCNNTETEWRTMSKYVLDAISVGANVLWQGNKNISSFLLICSTYR